MEAPNAFIGRKQPPASAEIEEALGKSAQAWTALVKWMAENGIADQEWKSSSPRYGWSLRMKQKKRTIVYLGPCVGCFRVGFVLGDKAIRATKESGLPQEVMEAINQAPRYAEGTGVRLMVMKASDLAPIKKLAAIKLAN